VVNWLRSLEDSALYLSVLSLGEFHQGIAKLREGSKRERLQAWVDIELAGRFQGRILTVDQRIASLWGRICGEAERKGEKLPVIDGLIGATALVHGLTVASRNTAVIARTGARVFNPWS